MHLPPLPTAFLLIFVAELGDKTLYTILLLATRNAAFPVLIGACAAFVVQGLIALALGSLLAMLPAAWVVWITAGVFLFFGIKLLVTNEEKSETESTPSKHRVAITTFFMVTAAEWGDASQIGTAALVAHLHAPVQVVIGATLGLWTGSALAVGVGRVIGTRIPAHWLRRSAGILFCAFALITVLRR